MAQTHNNYVLTQAGDRWVSPGGIDLQINGALGIAFNELDATTGQRLPEIRRFLWKLGIDGFLPTLVTTSVPRLHQALETLAADMGRSPAPNEAAILGVHLEGPFLNPGKRGAHPAAHLLPLTLDALQRVLGDYAAIVRVITLAPELDPSGNAIAMLRNQGIVVSLGHSMATFDEAKQAIDCGATMVTHAFNAMPGLHHRDPGLLAAALLDERVWCGAIADGAHVHPAMLDLLVRLKGDRLFLVSDALAPLGLPEGDYPWDTRTIAVREGTARLADGTLSGTTLSLLEGARNLVRWGICSAEQAIARATVSPRQAIGLPEPPNYAPDCAPRLQWQLQEGDLTWQAWQADCESA